MNPVLAMINLSICALIMIIEMENSLGIKTILDSKTENGKLMYLVQWTATWECAESLAECQTLVDQFWQNVNQSVVHQMEAEKARQDLRNNNKLSDFKLNDDFKNFVNNLDTPSKLLQNSSTKPTSIPTLKQAVSKPIIESDNFDSPYVNLINRFECKICGREQPKDRKSDWKRHWLTHASNDQMPHKCEICNKGFVQKGTYTNHMKRQHPEVKLEVC